MKYVQFDKPTLTRFKAAYHLALLRDQSTFTFDNHEFLVAYAKYLIEYLTHLENHDGEIYLTD